MALGFVEVFVDAFANVFAAVFVFVSGVGSGMIRALFANGDCVAALWLSAVSGVDEAADELSPGPHASSMMVASTTITAVDRVVDTRF